MPVQKDIGSLDDRVVLTITEAAAFANSTSVSLLKAGASGTIRLCTRVPEDHIVLNIDRRVLRDHRKTANAAIARIEGQMSFAVIKTVADYLILSPADCTKILQHGSLVQRVFTTVLRTSGSELINVESEFPAETSSCGIDVTPDPISPFDAFVFVTCDVDEPFPQEVHGSYLYPCPINIELKDLFIPTEDLGCLSAEDNESVALATDNQIADSCDYQTPQPHMSPQLCHVLKVAEKFWNKIYNEEEKYPSKQKLIEALMDIDGPEFSKTYAARAETIIRPIYAEGKPSSRAQFSVDTFVTTNLKSLIDTSKHFYGDENISPSSIQSQTIEKYLIEKHIFHNHAAKAGAWIIRHLNK